MNKTQREGFEMLLKRLKEPRAGCAAPFPGNEEKLPRDYEGISRIYITTWLQSPLELLLSDRIDDQRLGRDMLRR